VPEYRAKPLSTVVYTDSSKSKTAVTTVMRPGSTAWVEMKFVNTGRSAWTGLQLATQVPVDHDSALAQGWAAPNRAAVQSEASVIPGNVATFGFAIRIPAGLADGTPVVENFSPVLPDGARVGYGNSKVSMVADSRSLFVTQPTPSISGTTAQDNVLSAGAGNWKPAGATFTYAWKRDGVAVAGATGTTYALTDQDVGRTMSVTVTASAKGFISASKTSVVTAPVASKFSNTAASGTKLTAGGTQIVSANGAFRVFQRADGYLVKQNVKTGKVVWFGKKAPRGSSTSIGQSLVIVSPANKTVWSSRTSGLGVTKLVLSTTGRLTLQTAANKVVYVVQ